MDRKVYVEVKVRLILDLDEGIEVSEAMDAVDPSFKSGLDGVDILDAEIIGHAVTDSK